jgi:hypothetical protein
MIWRGEQTSTEPQSEIDTTGHTRDIMMVVSVPSYMQGPGVIALDMEWLAAFVRDA